MKISIDHGEVKQGMIFGKRFHTVSVNVMFSNEELAIIKQRKLERDVILPRDPAANAKVVKANSVMNVGKVLTGLATTENAWHLTIGKLMKGPDVYTLETPIEAKAYEEALVDGLRKMKSYIEQNADGGESKSFEL